MRVDHTIMQRVKGAIVVHGREAEWYGRARGGITKNNKNGSQTRTNSEAMRGRGMKLGEELGE